MAYTYDWKIDKIFKREQHGDLYNVVKKIEWRVTGTDSDGYSGTTFGATSFRNRHIDSSNLTPFSSITEDQMISWIRITDTYMELINSQIKKEILKKRNDNKEVDGIMVEVDSADYPWL